MHPHVCSTVAKPASFHWCLRAPVLQLSATHHVGDSLQRSRPPPHHQTHQTPDHPTRQGLLHISWKFSWQKNCVAKVLGVCMIAAYTCCFHTPSLWTRTSHVLTISYSTHGLHGQVSATIMLRTPKTTVIKLPQKISIVAGLYSMTGTANWPQLSPAITVLNNSRLALITEDVADKHSLQSWDFNSHFKQFASFCQAMWKLKRQARKRSNRTNRARFQLVPWWRTCNLKTESGLDPWEGDSKEMKAVQQWKNEWMERMTMWCNMRMWLVM